MKVVELHDVIVGEIARIIPVKTDRDTIVVKVGHLVVLHKYVVGVSDGDAVTSRQHSPAASDQIVSDVDVLRYGRIGVASRDFVS